MQNQADESNQLPKGEDWLSIGEASELLGISRDTLRRWEKKGKTRAYRSPTNRRYYKRRELQQLFAPGINTKKDIPEVLVQPTGHSEIEDQVPIHPHDTTQTPAQVGNNQEEKQVSTPSENEKIPRLAVEIQSQQSQQQTQGASQAETIQEPQQASTQHQLPPQPKQAEQAQESEDIVEIKPKQYQMSSNPNEDLDKNSQVKNSEGKSGSKFKLFKIIMMVVSVVLIIAGIIIVSLIFFLSPGGSSGTLSPV